MNDIKQLLYIVANEVYWKTFLTSGFWFFAALTIFITEVLFAFILPESKALFLGENFDLSYSLRFFGLFTVFFYPLVYWYTNRRKI